MSIFVEDLLLKYFMMTVILIALSSQSCFVLRLSVNKQI